MLLSLLLFDVLSKTTIFVIGCRSKAHMSIFKTQTSQKACLHGKIMELAKFSIQTKHLFGIVLNSCCCGCDFMLQSDPLIAALREITSCSLLSALFPRGIRNSFLTSFVDVTSKAVRPWWSTRPTSAPLCKSSCATCTEANEQAEWRAVC